MTKNISINKIIILAMVVGLALAFYLSISIKKAEASEQILPSCWRCPGGGKWDPLLRKCQFSPLPLIACTAQYDPVCGCVFDNGKPNYVTFSNSCVAQTKGIIQPITLDPDGDGVVNNDICPPLQCFARFGGGSITSIASGIRSSFDLVPARLSEMPRVSYVDDCLRIVDGKVVPCSGLKTSWGGVSGAVDCRGLTSAECELKYPTRSVVCLPGQTCKAVY